MAENKRPPKRVKSFRLTWAAYESLARLSRRSGMSEGQIVEWAIAEFIRNHPDMLLETRQTAAALKQEE